MSNPNELPEFSNGPPTQTNPLEEYVISMDASASAGENWTRATIETTDELAHWASDRFEEVKANPSPPAVRIFADHSAAFDYCRECNSPVRVVINGFWWKLFPSGRAYEQERFTA